jgi:hypothetical protein
LHEYHIDVTQPLGGVKTFKVTIDDENHHSNWSATKDFVAFLGSVAGVAAFLISEWRHVKKV